MSTPIVPSSSSSHSHPLPPALASTGTSSTLTSMDLPSSVTPSVAPHSCSSSSNVHDSSHREHHHQPISIGSSTATASALLSQESQDLPLSFVTSSTSSSGNSGSDRDEKFLETPAACSNKRCRVEDDDDDNDDNGGCCSSSTIMTMMTTGDNPATSSPLFGLTLTHCKRQDYLSWQEYFIAVALLSSLRSKDPYHPSGACLVDAENRIVGIGYNGFPSGFPDDTLSWENPSETVTWLESREPFVIHAEVNCLLNSAKTTNNLTMYCVDFPCHECAKFIVQSRRVSKVVVHGRGGTSGRSSSSSRGSSLKAADAPLHTQNEADSVRVSQVLLRQAGIAVEEYHLQRPIQLSFTTTDTDTNTNTEIQPPPPPQSYLSWDEYYMAMALLTSRRSKDPNTQVGACIVSPRRIILGCGYNGFTAGCSDDAFPWQRSAQDPKHTKYMYVCHAEVNALLNSQVAYPRDLEGCTLYVTLFPCHHCAQALVQVGIRRVVYLRDPYHSDDKFRASRMLLDTAGISYEEFQPSRPCVTLQK